MAPHIDREADHIRDKARRDLLAILESVRGKKNVVFSKDLPALVGLFVGFTTLKEYGVEKVFVLENGNTDASQRNIIYIINSEKAELVQAVAAQIKQLQRNAQVEHEITVVWVPRRTLVSNKILEDEGILGDVNIQELSILFLPLESDLLSLELNNDFHSLYLDGDTSCIFHAARALMQIQQRHGLFPRILGKGDNANKLSKLLVRARKELDADDASTPYTNMPSTSIESCIILDRDVDLATVLLTQLTYEGLIDEYIGIRHNKAEVDSSIAGASGQGKNITTGANALKQQIQLDSSDSLYVQLRDTNFALIGPILNRIARRLKSESSVPLASQGINELKEFVNKLPAYQTEHKSLAVHTNLADELTKSTRTDIFNRALEVQQTIAAGTDPISQHETIEELILRDVPIADVLRLLCLESTMSGGLRAKDLDYFKRLILQSYGYQHLLSLHRLEKMELLQSRTSATALLLPVGTSNANVAGTKTNYAYLRKELRLVLDEYNEDDPEDISYVYSGYAPLSVRIVQCILQKQYLQTLHKSPLPITGHSTGWTGFEDILKSAKGPTFSIIQKATDEKAERAKTALLAGDRSVKTVLVMFLGGITRAEIAALRFVSRKMQEQGQRKKIIICTTGVISGRSVMEDVIEKQSLGNGSTTPP